MGEGQKQGQSPAKDKTSNKCKISHFPINVHHLTGHEVKVNRHRGCCRENQLQQSDHNKDLGQPYPGQNPYSSWVHMDALVLQCLTQLTAMLPEIYDQWLYLPLLQSSNDEISLNCVVSLMLLLLCYCIFFLKMTSSYLQKQLVSGDCCLVTNLLDACTFSCL